MKFCSNILYCEKMYGKIVKNAPLKYNVPSQPKTMKQKLHVSLAWDTLKPNLFFK